MSDNYEDEAGTNGDKLSEEEVADQQVERSAEEEDVASEPAMEEAVAKTDAQKTFEEDFEFWDPTTGKTGHDERMPVPTMGAPLSDEDMEAIVEEIEKNDNIDKRTKARILQNITLLAQSRFEEDQYFSLSDAPKRGWKQRPEFEGRRFGIMTKKNRNVDDGSVLSGEAASNYINGIMGFSVPAFVECWNSGINMTLSNIKEYEIHMLIARIRKAQSEIGANTRGALFTGDDVIANRFIMRFVLDHVKSTSVKGWTKELLEELILVSDFKPIMTAVLASIYPDGYPTTRTCRKTFTNECTYGAELKVNEAKNDFDYNSMIDFKKIPWVDVDRLTAADYRLIGADKESSTVEEIEQYQERTATDKKVAVIKSDNITFEIIGRHPSAKTYFTYGVEWVNSIRIKVNELMKDSTFDDRDEREEYKYQQFSLLAKALEAPKYIPWIHKIIVRHPDGKVVRVESSESIENTLTGHFGEEYIEEIRKGVVQYKDEVTLVTCGLASFVCPVCGDKQVDDDDPIPSLTPFNPISYFLDIGEWMQTRMLGR